MPTIAPLHFRTETGINEMKMMARCAKEAGTSFHIFNKLLSLSHTCTQTLKMLATAIHTPG